MWAANMCRGVDHSVMVRQRTARVTDAGLHRPIGGELPVALAMAGREVVGRGGSGRGKAEVVTKTRPKTKKPSLYKVLLLNDDYTPMEFVVFVLERFFGKGREEATRIMYHVHHKGVGVCGIYTYEVAETKVTQVMDFARANQHPLQCTMEKE